MKIKTTNDSFILIPENSWEERQLKELRNKTIEPIVRYEDDWNQTGGVILQYKTHPWDK